MQLPHFSQASILVVGDVMLDRYWSGDAQRLSPEAPVPVVHIKTVNERPGGAGNVALNIAALGANVTLLGTLGDDDTAHRLLDQLTAAGVQCDISTLPGRQTITKLRVLCRHQQLIRLDFEEKYPVLATDPLPVLYKKHLKNSDLVVLSDYNKGTLTSASYFIQQAKALGIPVIVDPKGTDFERYRGADIITPNMKEFEEIVGPCQDEEDILQKAHAFLNQYAITSLLLTRGEQGMTLIQKDTECYHLPATAREVFDVTGAGDTVVATLATALAAHMPLQTAIKLSNIAAGIVVTKLGTASISAPELSLALSEESAMQSGIVTEEQLVALVSAARSHGKKIVFTNGCFDILHAGHVTYLQQAKQLGDILIVGVNDDASVRALKGAGRPINTLPHRMAVLAGLGKVDWVIPFADATPERLLHAIQPDILVKGGDYLSHQVVGADIVLTYGGEVKVLGLIQDLSTTSLIERMSHTVKETVK